MVLSISYDPAGAGTCWPAVFPSRKAGPWALFFRPLPRADLTARKTNQVTLGVSPAGAACCAGTPGGCGRDRRARRQRYNVFQGRRPWSPRRPPRNHERGERASRANSGSPVTGRRPRDDYRRDAGATCLRRDAAAGIFRAGGAAWRGPVWQL